jgi:pimeloyl-ACP methyl ester carboxylesterase
VSDALPIVLVPGLACSPRLYGEQLPALWRHGPVMVADHTRADSMAEIAAQVLAAAPPRFALAGLSMGGYISMEILRQAPGRVDRLALLDTAARPDTPEQSERRRGQIALAQAGRLAEVIDQLFPILVHANRQEDATLRELTRQMADEVGPEAFVRQQTAIMGRIDSRPSLAAIACPTLVLVGDGDQLTPPDRAEEIAAVTPGAQLVVIQESGHLSTLEQPKAVTEALERWIHL